MQMNLVRGIFTQPLFAHRDDGDGFPAYVRSAERVRMDVNDWIEANLGWVPALPVLEELVFPLLTDTSSVCEVGVGTGRWSRHILTKIPHGKMLLVDKSEWITDFLTDYFRGERNVHVVRGDGFSVPGSESEWADIVFSQGMFITLKLGHILTYLRSFARALKPRGAAIFDFIDPETPGGWSFLMRESERAHDVFTYHTARSVEKCAHNAGFCVTDTRVVGKSTYMTLRKAGGVFA